MGDTPFYLSKQDLPNTVMFTDIVNYLQRELIFKKVISTPASPPTDYSALFVDTDGKFKIKKSDGTLIVIEDIITANDTKVTVKEESIPIGTAVINFTQGSDFDIAYNGLDGETTIAIADNAIGNDQIAAHTNDKITIAGSGQLPTVAPSNAEYLVKSANATLTNEIVLAAGSNISFDDSVGGTRTINAALGGGGAADFTNIFKLSGILSPADITGDTNNYAPAGGIADKNVFRIASSVNGANLTGLSGGTANQLLVLLNRRTDNTINLIAESNSSTAANRFFMPNNIALAPRTAVIMWYDGTTSRWRFLSGSIGSSGGGSPFTPGSQILTKSVSDTTFVNTTAQQTMLSYEFAAGAMGTDKVFKCVVRGTYLNNSGLTPKIRIQIRFGTTVMWEHTIGTISSSSNRRVFDLEFFFNNKDVHNSQQTSGHARLSDSDLPTTGFGRTSDDEMNGHGVISGIAAEATAAAAKSLTVLINHDTANANISFTRTLGFLREE